MKEGGLERKEEERIRERVEAIREEEMKPPRGFRRDDFEIMEQSVVGTNSPA